MLLGVGKGFLFTIERFNYNQLSVLSMYLFCESKSILKLKAY